MLIPLCHRHLKELFRPSSETKNVKKRRKEKIPCVATTQQWKEYHTKKKNEKKKLEGEKLERKRKREGKNTPWKF
jgi:hypothetical protein